MLGLLGAAGIAHSAESDKQARAWIWSSSANSTLNSPVTVNSSYRHVWGVERLWPSADNYFGSTATVTRKGTGRYQVRLVGMNTVGGNVQVTSYGGNRHCKTESWSRSGNDQLVNVRCFTATGAASNSRFVMTYQLQNIQTTVHPKAYVWANNASSSNYAPSATYSHNSTGAVNRAYRLGEGYYRVRMPGVNSTGKGGTVMVTAYGTDSVRCKTSHWSGSGADINAYVRCFDASGNLKNSRFTLSFLKEIGDFGGVVSEDTLEAAHAWVNTFPNPSSYYNYGGVTASQISTGRYRVNFPWKVAMNDTATMANAYGSSSDYCTVSSWSSDGANGTRAYINCYNKNGSAVNSLFNVQYLTNQIILF